MICLKVCYYLYLLSKAARVTVIWVVGNIEEVLKGSVQVFVGIKIRIEGGVLDVEVWVVVIVVIVIVIV